MRFPTSFAQKVSCVVSEADGSTKSEPGAVATGTNSQLGFVLNALRGSQFYVEPMPGRYRSRFSICRPTLNTVSFSS